MWQRVIASDQLAVQSAFQVLAAHGEIWESAADFKLWLQSHSDFVFYRPDSNYRLVVGFRFESDSRWRATLGAMDGELSLEALQTLLEKTIGFLRQQGGTSLIVRVRNLPPTNRFALVYQMAIALARGDASVASIVETNLGRRLEYCLSLRGEPS